MATSMTRRSQRAARARGENQGALLPSVHLCDSRPWQSAGEHNPRDASKFVRQRYHDLVVMHPALERIEPSPEPIS